MSASDTSNPWEAHAPVLDDVENAASSSSVSEQEGPDGEDEEEFKYPGEGNYSAQMDELFDDDDDDDTDTQGPKLKLGNDEEVEADDDDDDGFLYDGVDADVSVSYKDQLRDVLEQDHEEDGDTDADEVLQVERALVYETSSPVLAAVDVDESSVCVPG